MAQPCAFEMAILHLATGAVGAAQGVTKTRFVKTVTSYKSEQCQPMQITLSVHESITRGWSSQSSAVKDYIDPTCPASDAGRRFFGWLLPA